MVADISRKILDFNLIVILCSVGKEMVCLAILIIRVSIGSCRGLK